MAIIHDLLSDKEVRNSIRKRIIRFGGNRILKIYGSLNCKSGKKMKRENRIFFLSSSEAKSLGYRPCGHCMKNQYQQWKNENAIRKNNRVIAS
jgi:methylphosphotriester-DNA--protein-cysteine methyltransferase